LARSAAKIQGAVRKSLTITHFLFFFLFFVLFVGFVSRMFFDPHRALNLPQRRRRIRRWRKEKT
jgi:hypothetical protein